MLDRLADSFEAQRRFVANASHELRSPLTVIRSEAEVALANPEPDVDELREMAASVIEASRRTEALLTSLLILARSQRGLLREEEFDLAKAAGAAARLAEREAAAQSVRIEQALEPAPVAGRPRAARAPRGQPGRERRALQPARRLRLGAHAPRAPTARPSCESRTPGRG